MESRAFIKVKRAHLQLAEVRGTDCTYCPSEIARQLFPGFWQEKMDFVREVADELVNSQQLVVLQKGKVISVKPTKVKGPIRLRKNNILNKIIMKKIFRILTLIQVGYYAYDMLKNKRSFKEEFVPNLKKVKRKLF